MQESTSAATAGALNDCCFVIFVLKRRAQGKTNLFARTEERQVHFSRPSATMYIVQCTCTYTRTRILATATSVEYTLHIIVYGAGWYDVCARYRRKSSNEKPI